MCTPVVAMGGEKGLGAKVGQGVSLVAENVEAHTLTDCGHFLPEERPYEIVEQIVAMARRRSTS
jgi:pimeloyl-ACP methyl ester carboxylesterase